VPTNNPYDILGIKPDATDDDINTAYKAKAKQTHPDQGGDAEEFTRVKQASMVLLDPKQLTIINLTIPMP
jgi:curved DNA-binding protein CbpA